TKDNPYPNILPVRKADQKSHNINLLIELLHSHKIKQFIHKNYHPPLFPLSQ
ncbi:MetQ/NlpA family ABC transporter substrate-binding protein, partial [Bacillus pumilus]|uniref:MetQ/NlpA family ABC transporter substrate-binding protein n=1 Tax=Bacillus pumilus TaxID=1408 RepID=UPI003703B36D